MRVGLNEVGIAAVRALFTLLFALVTYYLYKRDSIHVEKKK
jgi:hypothetical protein